MYARRDVYAVVDGVRKMVAIKGQPVQEHFAQYVEQADTTPDQAEAIASSMEPADLPGEDLPSSMSGSRTTGENSEPVGDPARELPPAPSVVPPPAGAPAPEFYDEDVADEARVLGVTAEECTPDVDGDITEEEVRAAFFHKVTDREGLLAKARELGVKDVEDVGDDEVLREAITDQLNSLVDEGMLSQIAGPVDGQTGMPPVGDGQPEAPAAGTAPTPKAYTEMDKGELLAELERRGISVPRGRPTNGDLVKLLEEHTPAA